MTETDGPTVFGSGPSPPVDPTPPRERGWRSLLAATELDTRLLGMVVAIAVIWITFNVLSNCDFLTSRNLWNLSVQSTSIAIMATGMVLVIVSRNIDLSIGSTLGFTGMFMAMVQAEWLPKRSASGSTSRTRGSSPWPVDWPPAP